MICIVKKTGTKRWTTSSGSICKEFNRYLSTYLDESGKTALTANTDSFRPTPTEELVEEETEAVDDGKGPVTVLVPNDFVRGRLHAEGFVRDLLASEGMPGRTPKAPVGKRAWINRVTELWEEKICSKRYRPKNEKRGRALRHNIIFSIEADVCRELTKRGFSAVSFLEKVVERTWERYLEKQGFVGDQLGMVGAFHLDTNNLHYHASLFPWTKNGKQLVLFNHDNRRRDENDQAIYHLKELTNMACEEAEKLKALYLYSAIERDLDDRRSGWNLLASKEAFEDVSEWMVKGGASKERGIEKIGQEVARAFSEATGRDEDDALAMFNDYVFSAPEEVRDKTEYAFRIASRMMVALRHQVFFPYSEDVEDEEEEKLRKERLMARYREFWNPYTKVVRNKATLEEMEEQMKKAALAKANVAVQDIGSPLPKPIGDLQFFDFADKLHLWGRRVALEARLFDELSFGVAVNKVRAAFLSRKTLGLEETKKPERSKNVERVSGLDRGNKKGPE